MLHFNDSSSELAGEVERLKNGRELSPFDSEVMEVVAGLTLRLRFVRETIEREGQIVDDGKGFPVEHPCLAIEKRASSELRGWVKDRPDLFGEQKVKPVKVNKFEGFKAI